MNNIKVKIIVASFGFDEGQSYPATIQAGGFFVNNGHLGKFIPSDEASLITECAE